VGVLHARIALRARDAARQKARILFQPYIFNRDPAARGTVKTPALGSPGLFHIAVRNNDWGTDFCNFIVSIGAGATADSSIVLFS
jgi:hypothetical protein